jgi:hypothetical protein|tara:strand:- start:2997 stop:6614 length:3618 start_codon:yes stop_codon:yes gene_type:complete
MKTRLVAYRKTSALGTGKEKMFELDLQKDPNVPVNFQLSDITNPSKRKASFSQTFKLPFTQRNNSFFQNWFDVNLDTLVYSSAKKFPAVLYVGTLVQFEGVIQLKSVYMKAELYEVVVLGTTADLFTNIGSQKLRDIFLNSDGVTYNRDLNHTFNKTNIENSWTGDGTATFNNIDGVSLRDTVGNVQKVMYPLSITEPNFVYNVAEQQYLNLDQTTIDNTIANNEDGLANVSENVVNITQLRPAVQIREIFRRLLNRAGFTYTSNFIDGTYFRKLFMTTCNDQVVSGPVIRNASVIGSTQTDGFLVAGNDDYNYNNTIPSGQNIDCFGYTQGLALGYFTANTTSAYTGFTVPNDPMNIVRDNGRLFKKVSNNLQPLKFKTWLEFNNLRPCSDILGLESLWGPWSNMVLQITVKKYITDIGTASQFSYDSDLYTFDVPLVADTDLQTQQAIYGQVAVNIPIEFDIPWGTIAFGQAYGISMRLMGCTKKVLNDVTTIRLGRRCSPSLPIGATCGDASPTNYLFAGQFNEVSIGWSGYAATGIYDKEVDIPTCIDASITQKDFLQDIIERFNLVVAPDSNNPSNLRIEPYSDYLAISEFKSWSDKVDLSKEIVIKDTSSLQNKNIKLQDLEDIDLNNKRIAETTPVHNPYGKVSIQNTLNEFAKGELKNKSIFAPYINDKVWSSTTDATQPTQLLNMTVQYEISYSRNSEGLVEQKLEATKPKMFYYYGMPHSMYPPYSNYYMHRIYQTVPDNETIVEAFTFQSHPVCSPFEISPTTTIQGDTRSLYWNGNPPIAPSLTCFDYNSNLVNIARSLYFEYWAPYLNAIYATNSRIVELYLNLNSSDIHNFKFSDEIFIKDSYYRVLSIKNYIIGGSQSTKVTLLLINELYNKTCPECEYVVSSIISNQNNSLGPIMLWCPEDDADCNPGLAGIFTTEACCSCNNGEFFPTSASGGEGWCLANSSSLSVQSSNLRNLIPIFSSSLSKNLSSFIISNGKNGGFTIGNNTSAYRPNILASTPNDYVIKYKNENGKSAPFQGENHRIILMGYTEGNTRGYATTTGDNSNKSIKLPSLGTAVIRVTGSATVVGGTSTDYPLGYTESFAYFTAFSKNRKAEVTQIGTAGGVQEVAVKQDHTKPATCTLYITTITDTGIIQFGLDDSQTDLKRTWTLTVDINVQMIPNIGIPYQEKMSLFQDGELILFQNHEYLIWN